jgi:hypothetical protein
MARDIEEFLRKAAERRQQQKQGQPPQSLPVEPPSIVRPDRDEEIIETAEIVESRKTPKKKSTKRKRETVAEHVDRYLDTSEIKQKTANLGSQVAKVRDHFETTVHQHLDHDICSVDDDRQPSAGQSSSATPDGRAMQLKQMLGRPESVGQAILISEILNRPKFEDD